MHIFVASSGRCGTGYLASCFANYTNISVASEEAPVLVGPLLSEANRQGTSSKALKDKAKAIAQAPFT